MTTTDTAGVTTPYAKRTAHFGGPLFFLSRLLRLFASNYARRLEAIEAVLLPAPRTTWQRVIVPIGKTKQEAAAAYATARGLDVDDVQPCTPPHTAICCKGIPAHGGSPRRSVGPTVLRGAKFVHGELAVHRSAPPARMWTKGGRSGAAMSLPTSSTGHARGRREIPCLTTRSRASGSGGVTFTGVVTAVERFAVFRTVHCSQSTDAPYSGSVQHAGTPHP